MSESLYSLLQIAARRHPDRIAVDYAAQTITHAELLERAERLAGLLHDRGVRPGVHIAFCFRKSIDAIVSLFGIIRTGAAYVPVDPAWPIHRIATICDDADIHHWVGTHPPPVGIPKMDLILTSSADDSRGMMIEAIAGSPPMPGEPILPTGDVCSLLYTSGSSGSPKGVRITSRSLLHFSRWAVDAFDLSPADRMANHAPFHFDLSTFDIFGAVRAGATLCPVPDRIRGFPVETAKFIDAHRISVWYSVPSVLSQLVSRAWNNGCNADSLRVVLFAGEVMPKPVIAVLARLLPCMRFANLYGPTETNVCTCHAVTNDDLTDHGPLPIGLPIDETRVWIADQAGRIDPTVDAGDLWVAGPTVAAGYHGHASQCDRFVPAPDGNGQAYRTGDRVKRRADGVLLFEGRIDRQIKSRGYRVEPGEIEAVIARHPSVREVAVVPIPDPHFGHRILACLASHMPAKQAQDEIAAYCRSRLPVYMVPDSWVFQDALPRTDRGKIDLQAIMSLGS